MKKVNFKVVGAVACFIISIIFLFCSKLSKYCTFFACLFMVLCLVLYALFRQEQVNKTLKETDLDLEENPTDEDELVEIEKLKKKLIKKSRRLNFTFYTCAFLLAVFGVVSLF